MSETEQAPRKKGKLGRLLIMLVVTLAMGGAGAAGGLYAAGAFHLNEEKEAAPQEDPRRPRLVLAGEDPEEVAARFSGVKDKEEGSAPVAKGFRLPAGGVDLPRPRNIASFHATYYQIPVPFTSNLVDTDAFAQISVAVSTYYDMRVIDALKTHEMALRSAMLVTLSQQSQTALSTPQGKALLQRQLTQLVNKVLKEKTGYGGVDNIYFTNFVIQ